MSKKCLTQHIEFYKSLSEIVKSLVLRPPGKEKTSKACIQASLFGKKGSFSVNLCLQAG